MKILKAFTVALSLSLGSQFFTLTSAFEAQTSLPAMTQTIGGNDVTEAEQTNSPLGALGRKIPTYNFQTGEFTYKAICSVTALSPYYGVTTAHCFFNNGLLLPESHFVGQFGVTNLPNTVIKQSDASIISDIYIHPKYQRYPVPTNDIAIVKFTNPIQADYPILPHPDMMSLFDNIIKSGADIIMNIRGWGYDRYLDNNGNWVLYRPDNMQTISIPIISINKTTVISGEENIDVASCRGDSGSMLFNKLNIGGVSKYFGIGLVSYGYYTCDGNTNVATYEKLSSHYSWIKSIITQSQWVQPIDLDIISLVTN